MSSSRGDTFLSSGEAANALLPSLVSLSVGTGMDADERKTQTRRSRSLLSACIADDADQVRTLLAEGAAVNPEVAGRVTPLHVASICDSFDCMALLLEAEANVHAVDGDGRGPLHEACTRRCVALLLQAGANVNADDDAGETPLNKAAKDGRDDCVALLLQHGADVARANKGRPTPIMFACMMNRLGSARLLLEYGADTNGVFLHESTPSLHYACNWHKDEIAKLLLEYGADVHVRDNDGRTALHEACRTNNSHCVKLLLEHGAEVDWRDDRDHTPLHYACKDARRGDCVRLLLAAGANAYAPTAYSQNYAPWDMANEVSFAFGTFVLRADKVYESVGGLPLGWTKDAHDLFKSEKRAAVEGALRALLLAEARRAGCALSEDAAESVLRAVAS
jgi:ankyrin repeat protein